MKNICMYKYPNYIFNAMVIAFRVLPTVFEPIKLDLTKIFPLA